MFDYKKFAMVLGIMILLPLFFGLFVDAIYEEPEYSDYCKDNYIYEKPVMPVAGVNCTYDYYNSPEAQNCSASKGMVRTKPDSQGCHVYSHCDYCQRDYDDAREVYNRNIFFILAPLGLIVIVIGLYVVADYMGAGLMLGGLITIFYATMRYFSDMSKLMRALVILIELLIIIWIGYNKIDRGKKPDEQAKTRRRP